MDELELARVTTSAVGENGSEYTKVMLKHFGDGFPWTVEAQVYGWMDRLSPEYRGGQWKLHELSNGGFWMYPDVDALKLEWHGNGFEETVNAEVAGIVACLFCFCYLAETSPPSRAERFAAYYHHLRDYALTRPDHVTILRAID